MVTVLRRQLLLLFLALTIWGCAGSTGSDHAISQQAAKPGPDKQGEGMLLGVVSGAGAGAVTGAQVASATGPGALIGAGIGAVAGSIRGFMQDEFEEELLAVSRDVRRERERAFAQEVLTDHYERRGELHPSRDIFPADLFFIGDEAVLRPSAKAILRELYFVHLQRYGWSRLRIQCYIKSRDKENTYALRLAESRSEAIGNELIRLGMTPRRVQAFGVLVDEPVLIDPVDSPLRYAAAVEFLPWDAEN